MNIRLAQPEDSDKWDHYISSYSDATHTHFWGWKKVIEDSYHKKAYYYLAEQDEKIIGILPIFHIKSLIFGNELVSMPYTTYGGVLADTPGILKNLIDAAVELAKNENVAIIKLRQKQKISGKEIENSEIIRDGSKVSMRLSLNTDSEQQFSNFKAKLRNQIRRPQKEGMTFKMGSTELINDFYKIFSVNMRDLGSPVHSKNLFMNLCIQFPETVKVGVVYFKSIPVAAGIITIMKDMVEIPWASSLRKYNRYGPNMLLYWSFLEYCCNIGIKYFDFGRSTPGEGTYKFKEQWGAEEYQLYWYNKYNNGIRKQIDKSNQSLAKIWSKIPVRLTTLIGPSIRKNISL